MLKFKIYKMQSPSGRCYVGYTSQSLKHRMQGHLGRARKGDTLPLYEAIRKYGIEAFTITIILEVETKMEAWAEEEAQIAVLVNGYNISAGGSHDAEYAADYIKQLKKDPKAYKSYTDKLSASVKSSVFHQNHVIELEKLAAEWRKQNPVLAYKNSMRALRFADKVNADNIPVGTMTGRKHSESSKLKMSESQLLRIDNLKPSQTKHRSIASRLAATKQWASLDVLEKKAITTKISNSLKEYNDALSIDDVAKRQIHLANMRANIDHNFRKSQQKIALAAYWTPERRLEKSVKAKAKNLALKAAKV